MTIEKINANIKKYSPRVDLDKVNEAFVYAKKAHAGQTRYTGKPFIDHPLHVAYHLSRFNVDTATIIASILHDIVEDTDVSLADIKKKFGPDVATLVEGATKLNKIKFRIRDESYYIENVRKMLVAMAQDIRVVLIKLADRLHNMQTLDAIPAEKQKRIAKETIEIYAPLASRLGMGEIKGQLEDLAFPYLYPNEYEWTKNLIAAELHKKEDYIEKIVEEIKAKLRKEKLKIIDIHGRIKHLYSLYRKLQKHENDINKIYDIVAVRVIVDDISSCYSALGIIHHMWKPLIGRIKDYIATPKTNGYQSLHTTVITDQGELVEIQIRTMAMHQEAEYGIAAHWHYDEQAKTKDGKKSNNIPQEKIIWLNDLLKWQQDMEDTSRFAESLKGDVFKDRIFVFTPQGEIMDLPEGATPVDFAYQIHTEVGHRCLEAKVNYKISPLDQQLENGDVVEIITGNTENPRRDWLYFVKTNFARNNIRNWFKKISKEKNLESGREIINSELKKLKKPEIKKISKDKIEKLLDKLPYKNLDGLLVAIGQGDINSNYVIKNLFVPGELIKKKPNKLFFFGLAGKTKRAIIEGDGGFLTNFAKCCNPLPGDQIKAHITRSKGATVHRANCSELKKVEEGRIANASWENDYIKLSRVTIEIKSFDRLGLIKDLTSVIASYGINIISLDFKESRHQDILLGKITAEVKDLDQLVNLLHDLERVKGVAGVKRL